MDFSKIAIFNQTLQGPLGSIVGALIILIIGWIIASLVRRALATVLSKTSLDTRLSQGAGIQPISGVIADLVYWFILLIVLTMTVGRLGLNGLFTPLTNMIDKTFAFMPNALLAAFVMFIGFIVAKIVRSMVTTVVSRLNLQALFNKAGVSDQNNLPSIAGSIVFLLTIIPFSIAALDALKVESISRPATNMLNKIMEALPNVFTALAILVITYLVVRLVANIIKGLIADTQLDTLPEKVGLQSVLGSKKLSDVIACGILFFAMLFAVVAAADLLGFVPISDIITMFIAFGAQIILGAVILTIGFWLANLIAGAVERSEQGSKFLANIVRVLIMGLVLAMGLKAMGIADSIVNLAFGLTLGAVAVAFALSFGLGGQEAAARYLRRLQDKLEKNDE
ncbi:mechanosensitive ion channel [Moraxella sp. FZLJ2107]|uniref:mechanosensitive ion channel n=1 Tax=unclassified Moraxella TaxID=2685852 RepID=UPI00209C2459|nr:MULTISPECIES: mechanosensitive ion channel [unclassified Moraxella]USZ13991.1 mechanosensitive ion channel [Moraxella sp. FZFQ2102]UTO04255.1 mechanosensitive ion channel [Moraxella sp. FZLJ2107]UTO23088.1 mechanosensitive ion channel [Moraxella sp. FZLJ2109]